MRPFQFSAAVQGVFDGPTLTEMARRAEASGFTSLVVPDHLIPQLSPVPAMATIAAATTDAPGRCLRAQQRPAPPGGPRPGPRLDRRAERRSAGRRDRRGLEQGRVRRHRPRLRRRPVRVARLEEAVAVLKGSFADGPLVRRPALPARPSYDGQPKPVQRPHPPFLIGGGGKRMLSLAGREAQIVGLAPRQLAGSGSTRAASPGRPRPRRSAGSARPPAIGPTT